MVLPRLRLARPDLAAYRLGRNAAIVLWYTLSKGLTLALFGLLFNLYLYALGFDRAFIGIVNALPALSSVLAAIPAGMLGDRLGQRPLLLFTGVATPITLLGLALSSAAPLLALFALCNGIVTTCYWVSAVPLLANSVEPERRVRIFSLNSFLLWGAGSLGYLIGGQVVALAARLLHEAQRDVAPLRWGMLVIVVVAMIGALPLPWLHGRARGAETRHERAPYDVRLYARLLGPDVLLTCGGGMVAGFIGLYLTIRFGARPGALGDFLALSGVIGGVLVLLAPRVADRLGTTRAAVILQAAGVPAILLLTLAPTQALAMLGEVLRNGFRSMGDPVYNAFVMSRVPAEQRATISGLYSTTWSIGFSIGPAVSGLVQQRAGFTPAFLVGAGSMATGATLLYLFFVRGRTAA